MKGMKFLALALLASLALAGCAEALRAVDEFAAADPAGGAGVASGLKAAIYGLLGTFGLSLGANILQGACNVWTALRGRKNASVAEETMLALNEFKHALEEAAPEQAAVLIPKINAAYELAGCAERACKIYENVFKKSAKAG